MIIPSFYYGTYREVKSRCQSIVKDISKDRQWSTLDFRSGTNTCDNRALIILDGPNRALSSEPHFHCYLLHSLIRQALHKNQILSSTESVIFKKSLNTAWGTLSLLAHANIMWLYPKERHSVLLQAIKNFWDLLYAEGNRYSNGSNNGTNLWSLHTNLKYVLAKSGIEAKLLQEPLPPGGLDKLFLQIKKIL